MTIKDYMLRHRKEKKEQQNKTKQKKKQHFFPLSHLTFMNKKFPDSIVWRW